MQRRFLLTLTLLAVVLAVALLPSSRQGRGWLLDRARGAAESAGYELSWEGSAGSAWRQVTLTSARVRGPGLDAEIDHATVGWFLPALLTGDLPLSVSVDGARVDLDAAALELGGEGGGGELPVQPELRDLDLANVRLRVDEAPYTLPDMHTEDLVVRGGGRGVEAQGRLTTPEGSLAFDARVGLAPFTLSADVRDGDVRVARRWWRGITGGRADGRVTFTPEAGLRASLDVREGSLDAAGIEVTQVEGPVTLAGGLIRTTLSGTALGGNVTATGRVDVPDREWSASLNGTAALADAADWAGRGAVPAALTPDGEARITAHASGWTAVEVLGRVDAEGTLDERPFTLRSEDVRYTRAGGLSASAAGTALGGTFAAATDVQESDVQESDGREGDARVGEPVWTVSLSDAAYGPAQAVEATARLRTGPLRGRFTGAGTLGDRASLEVDGEVEAGTVRAFLGGDLAPGGRLAGAAAWREGTLTGGVRLQGWAPADLDPLTAELRVDGPPDALPWTLALEGDQPWSPALAGATLDADLRGEVRGVLDEGTLTGIEGALGPLTLAGELPLTAGGAPAQPRGPDAAAGLRWSLAPTPLRVGEARSELSVREGTVTGLPPTEGTPLEVRGQLRAAETTRAPVALGTVEGAFRLGWRAGADPATSGLQARLEGPRLQAELVEGRLDADVQDLPLSVGEVRGPLTATLTADASDPWRTLRGEATFDAGPAPLSATAHENGVRLAGTLPAGTRLAGLELRRDVRLSADLDHEARGTLAAESEGARLDGVLDPEGEVPFRGTLVTGDGAAGRSEVVARPDPWRAVLTGGMALAPLGELAGVPLGGSLALNEVTLSPGAATGTARLDLEQPAPLTATWRDGSVRGEAETPAGAVELTGTLLPGATPTLAATHAWGEVRAGPDGLRGEGTLPAQRWRGVRVAALPWSLTRREEQGGAPAFLPALQVGASTIIWAEDGLNAELDLPLEIGAEAARLQGTARLLGDAPELDLRLQGPAGGTASLTGPPDAATLRATLAAATASAAGALDVALPGTLDLGGRLDLSAPSWTLTGDWAVGEDALRVESSGPERMDLTLSGAGLELVARPGEAHLRANDAAPGTFLPVLAGLRLDGELHAELPGTPEAGPEWRGALEAWHTRWGRATLRGEGAELTAEADAAWRTLEAQAGGTLFPRLALDATLAERTTGARAEVRLSGPEDGGLPTPATVRASGGVSWPRLGPPDYALEASSLTLEGTLADPVLTGPLGGAVRLREARPTGTLTLPATVAGLPHPLTLGVAGTLAEPRVRARLSGDAGSAEASVGDPDADAWLALDAQATPEAWPASVGVAEPAGATLRATLDRAGAWTARLTAGIAPAGRAVELRGEARGTGMEGTAEWSLAPGPEAREATLLGGTATITPEEVTARASLDTLDLAALGRLVGAELTGTASGEVTARVRPGAAEAFTVRSDARVDGRALGTELALEVRSGGGDDLVHARAGEVEATLDRLPAGGDWEVRAVGPEVALAGVLAGDLRGLDLEGTAWGAPATLRTAGGEDGSLVAVGETAGARASLGVRSGADGLALSLDASVPARAELAVTGTLTARGEVREGRAELTRADLALLAPADVRADLTGTVWPELDLRGAARLADLPLEEATGDIAAADPHPAPGAPEDAPAAPPNLGVTLRGPPTGATLRASLPGLTVRADLNGARPVAATLSGAGVEAYGLTFAPGDGGLRWTAREGYGGSARLTLAGEAPGDVRLTADLRGSAGGLEARLDADASAGPAQGEVHLDALLTGVPWAGHWSGDGRLALDAAPSEEAGARLEGPLELSGELLAPVLSGPLTLSGASEAEGTLRVARDGARLDLAGPHLDLDASADAEGWRADARSTTLSLAPWLDGLGGGALRETTLDAELRAHAAWGAAPEVRVPSWALRAGSAAVEGSAQLQEDLSVQASLDVGLAALLGDAASGRLHGPLRLSLPAGAPWSEATLRGALSLEQVATDGTMVSGDLAVDGSLRTPDLTANLTFDGELEGPLRVRVDAGNDRVDLDADLRAGATRLELRALGPPGALRVDTTLSVGARTLTASGEAAARLDLPAGAPPAYGLDAHLDAHLDAAPASQEDPASHPVTVSLQGTGPDVRLGAGLPGLRLGLDLAGTRPVGLSLAGAGVRAYGVALTPGPDGLAWQPGRGWEGRATLATQGDGAPDAQRPPRAELRLRGHGDTLGASLDARAARGGATARATLDAALEGSAWAGRWSGTGRLEARVPAGDRSGDEAPLRVDAPLTLAGDALAPVLTGAPTLAGVSEARGALRLARDGLTLDLRGPAVTLDARVDGDGWRTDATLENFPLEPWLAELDGRRIREPRLEGELHANGGWGEAPEVRLPAWSLRAEGATVRGSATLGGETTLEASLDADLARLLGGDASGRLHGPLRVHLADGAPWSAARLEGRIMAEDARLAGAGADGRLTLGGALLAPELTLDVRLAGPVEGPLSLRLDADASSFELDADLAAGASRLTLRAAGDASAVSAEGGLHTPRGTLRARGEGATLVLDGEEGLSGVRAELLPFASQAPTTLLHLPLARAHPAADGTLDLVLDAGARAWLQGELRGAAAGGVALPPLSLRAEGSQLRATGASDETGGIEARLGLVDARWTLDLNELALPGELRTTASASGQGATGTLSGTLGRASSAERLALNATRSAGATTLRATGEVGGGQVELDLARDADGWTGPIHAAGVGTAAGTLELRGRATGDAPWPGASLDVVLDGPVPTRATLTAAAEPAGTPTAALDAELRPPGGAPLRLHGRLWPTLDLRVMEAGTTPGTPARLRAEDLLRGEAWRVEGLSTLRLPGTELTLRGTPEAGTPRLELAPRGVEDGTLWAELPAMAPLPALRTVWREGLTLRGDGSLGGAIDWRPPARATLDGLTWRGAWGVLELGGELREGRAELSGRMARAGDGAVPPALLSLLTAPFGEGPLAVHIEGGVNAAELRLHAAEAGHDPAVEAAAPLRLAWQGTERTATLRVAGGPVTADLTLAPGAGLTGEVRLDAVSMDLPGLPAGSVNASLRADGVTVSGSATLSGPGRLSADGDLDLRTWLPQAYLPPGGPPLATSLSVRLAELRLDEVPAVSRLLPGLRGGLSALVEVRGQRVVAQVTAPGLATAERAVPLNLEAAGRLGAGEEGIDFGGSWAGSPIQGTLTADAVEVLWTLQRFPAQAALEARFGALDAVAEVTGVARVRVPFDAPGLPDARLATEHVRLERGGVVTTGTLSAELREGGLEIDGEFEGEGRWSASGTLRPDDLDFTLRAEEADAGPLLGLVPVLSRLGAGARGDLSVRAQGSLAEPRIEVATDGLELALAGARYRLESGSATLDGEALSVRTELAGVEPVGGLLSVEGTGRFSLAPWRLRDARIGLDGNVRLPVVGELEEVEGVLRADAEGRPRLEADARMGEPLRLEGTLWPLDVRLRGEELALRAPAFMLDQSRSDVDLRLRYQDGVLVSGGVEVRSGRFALGIRPRPEEEDADRRPNPALQRVVLNDVTLSGRRLTFSESFGSAEFEADLSLGGTAAEPRLSGNATAQRGTFRFSGREFDVQRATASFEPSRGVYPTLDVVAVASFEKRSVLQGTPEGTSFEAPPGNTIQVRLAFDAEVLPTPGEARPFHLDLDPELSSDARLAVPGLEGNGGATRSLREAELVSIIALGRLTAGGDPGAGGLAGGVAGSALDSAIDLLILSEIQQAVGDALGIDVVEIRTSTLSSVLEGRDDPFSVSLRLGGYLDEGLFASFEVGRLPGSAATEGLTNTLALTYELGPIEFDLSTQVAFQGDVSARPVPALGATLRYQLRPGLSLEGSTSVSTAESEARFGVTLRW